MALPDETFDQQVDAVVALLLQVRTCIQNFRWLLETGSSMTEAEMDTIVAEQMALIPPVLQPFATPDALSGSTGVVVVSRAVA